MHKPEKADKAAANYRVTRKVTLVGSVIDALLAVIKIIGGLVGQSQALVADGVHSLSDLATDVLVIWAAKHAKEGPDEEHPYGHERIETIATMALSVALIAVAVGFTWDAVLRLLDPSKLQQPGWLVLIAAAVSALAKEGTYHYTMRAAIRIDSNLLRANAWHSRSDAASSIIVLLGVVGIMLGFEYADALASIGVSLMIGLIGWSLGREGVEEVIDSGVDADTLSGMLNTIKSVEGVRDAHQTRTRKMAGKVVMDSHITVDSTITVSEGHRIGDAVERALHKQFKELSDITIHIDHEDDALERPGYHLPLRPQVLADMQHALAENNETSNGVTLDSFSKIKLHYLAGHIQLELWLDLPENRDDNEVLRKQRMLRGLFESIDYISAVEFAYRLAEPTTD